MGHKTHLNQWNPSIFDQTHPKRTLTQIPSAPAGSALTLEGFPFKDWLVQRKSEGNTSKAPTGSGSSFGLVGWPQKGSDWACFDFWFPYVPFLGFLEIPMPGNSWAFWFSRRFGRFMRFAVCRAFFAGGCPFFAGVLQQFAGGSCF